MYVSMLGRSRCLAQNSSERFHDLVLPSDLCFLLKATFIIYLQFDTLCFVSIFSHTHPPTKNQFHHQHYLPFSLWKYLFSLHLITRQIINFTWLHAQWICLLPYQQTFANETLLSNIPSLISDWLNNLSERSLSKAKRARLYPKCGFVFNSEVALLRLGNFTER